MSIVKHQLGDNILVVENDKHQNKYKFSLQYNVDTYENILTDNDINCLCPIFNVFPSMSWKIFQMKPTIQQMFDGNNMSAIWKVPVFGEDDQILTIELKLVLDKGDDFLMMNRQIKQLVAENDKLKKAFLEMKQNNDLANERIEKLNNDAFMTKIIHQNYIIDNLEEVFTFMNEEQKQLAFGLFDFNDRDNKITQKLYDRLMPLDLGKSKVYGTIDLQSKICWYLIKYIDPNYPQQSKSCDNSINTFFLKIYNILKNIIHNISCGPFERVYPSNVNEIPMMRRHSSWKMVMNSEKSEIFYEYCLILFNIIGYFADKIKMDILPRLYQADDDVEKIYLDLLYPAAIKYYMKEQVVNPKDGNPHETAIKALRILSQAKYV
jgi:hypothetical protein